MTTSKKNDAAIKQKSDKPKGISTNDNPKIKEADPQPNPAPQSNGPAKKNDPTRSLIMILAVVAVVVSLVYIYPYLSMMFGKQREVSTSVNELGQSHVKLEVEVHALEQKFNDLQEKVMKDLAEKDSLQLLTQRVDSLEKQQRQIDQETVDKALGGLKQMDQQFSQTIQTLIERVDTLEKVHATKQTQISKIPQTISSFTQLRDAIQSTKPFNEELEKIVSLTNPDDNEIQSRLPKLREIAKAGAPSYDQLENEFAIVAKELRRQAIPEDLPWYKKFVQRLRALVVVRKDGESIIGGTGIDGTLSEISQELHQKDLSSALTLAAKLPKEDVASFDTWRARVQDREFIDESYSILETSALTYLLRNDREEKSSSGNETAVKEGKS